MKINIRMLILYIVDITILLVVYSLGMTLVAPIHGAVIDNYWMIISAIIIVSIYTLFFVLTRAYNTIWRYASNGSYIMLFFITCISGVSSYLFNIVLMRNYMPISFYTSSILISAASIVLSRIVYREYSEYKAIIQKKFSDSPKTVKKRLLIIGAGAAGAMMVDELKRNSLDLTPVALIDDAEEKYGRNIMNVNVVGQCKDISTVCSEYKIELIYIAIPSATNEARARILDECAKTICPVKVLPYISESVLTKDIFKQVRDITPEELLGRDPIKLSSDDIVSFIKDKTVLVTGGGGSIGSELCRQIANCSPKKLIVVDIYENNAYEIEQELKRKYEDKLNFCAYIASVRDADKINCIMSVEKPDVVIHAAAHKHVPLMEFSPDEAVKNNIFGTLNTSRAAVKNKVKKFIMISTDKAVNPTNIMGATKRVCEMIIQYMDTISTNTSFVAVRFGNVLGSNGSVIPLFKNQIENRHNVTVTHPDMIRYFMTIPEASQLVLTAGAMANGGEIFVLDMGTPVKIDDLARKMINLAGLTLGKDINIEYVGLRPGEKLYEELLMSEEGLIKTQNSKIYVGKPIDIEYSSFIEKLDKLKQLVSKSSVERYEVEQFLMNIVPTFKRTVPDLSVIYPIDQLTIKTVNIE